MKKKLYDRKLAVEYAIEWAYRRNPKYYNFDPVGGDCTNFISQCVYAGAGVMNYTPILGWFYKSSTNRTPSWTGVEYFARFLTENNSIGPVGVYTDLNNIDLGDVIQLGNANGDFYHSLLVTGFNGPNVLVSTHTFDALNRPLSSYLFNMIRFIHISHVNFQ